MSMPVKKQVKLDNNFSISSPWEKDFRLPKSTHPDHYDLYIYPNLDKETFSGHVTITVTSFEARDYFLVHTKWLNITNTKISQVSEGKTKEVPIKEAFEYEPNEFWVISTDKIDPGKYKIHMNFAGSLKNGIVGFYMSSYINEKGEHRKLVTTKFEPTYARRAFPCFDEPSFKSTYTITVVRPSEDYIALSNMPVQSEVADKPSKGNTEVTFMKSVKMVTYLVCFIVCDFTYKERILPSHMPFRVYAPSSRIENTQYALDAGVSILQYYEDMFEKEFPLPKSDMAAIPDYSSGATEHWGIITYRETSLFYNENMSSATNQQRVASVVAHELAHQWFGNLVTLDWWDDLWLNEGFASYIEFKGVAHFEPTWDMETQFTIVNLQSVLTEDAKTSSHPIVHVVETPDEITAMFDSISYDKGSSVLRMLEDFMGENAFQRGINSFINKYKYDNAVTKDLWSELTKAWAESGPNSQKSDVGDIMDTWTRQMGYPVLTVSRSAPNTFTVTQKRFLQDPTAEYSPDESEFRYKWDVPVSYISSANLAEKKTWLYSNMDKLELQTDSEVSWLKLNVKQKGFYRVNYESSLWQELANVLIKNPQTFSPEDRAHLVNDALCLADSSLLDYGIALSITKGLIGEKHYVPWDAATVLLRTMEFLLLDTETDQAFKEYVTSLVEPSFKRLGWENTGSHLDRLLRSDIVLLACGSGMEDCISEATSYLSKWISDPNHQLPLGTKRQIYRWGILGDSDNTWWDVMWERCMAERSAAERDNLYYGLANSKSKKTLLQYIELAKDGKNVRSQDFLHVLQYISANTEGMDLVWDWVRTNWEWLVAQYTLNDRYLGQLIPGITKYFTSAKKLKEMEDFFTKYPEAGAGEQYRKQALETVKFNINWVQNYAPVIRDWLVKEKLN